ncbi:MAG: hypothetical protein PHG96_07955, partial [Kiritimatiellae bacterium]|nr:hypothetical protein [Kiritimatiellia bacterium]
PRDPAGERLAEIHGRDGGIHPAQRAVTHKQKGIAIEAGLQPIFERAPAGLGRCSPKKNKEGLLLFLA